ncbi:hypothetical protein [Spirosoma spitsbergense]|uniref:hypothetical protein n=1 Tax=Spirosoma spitsbergense TaxID=431554 RepID=UPI00037F4B9F|nr:hypothetical protein [Spirosoma spitsbergense]
MAQTFFRLKTAVLTIGVTEPVAISPTIAEPVKWSDVPLTGSVDEKYHGFNYNYSEGDLKLDFVCESSHKLLSQQYYRYGTDAVVQFQVVEVDRDGTEMIDYDGRLDFDTIDIQPGRVSISIVTNDDHTRLNARWETPISLESIVTMDNAAIGKTPTTEILLLGQTIHESGEFHKAEKFVESHAYTDGVGVGGIFYLLPKMYFPASPTPVIAPAVPAIPELSNLKGVNYLYGDVSPATFDPPALLGPTDTAGEYHIEIDWLFSINVSITNNTLNSIYKSKFGILNFQPVVVIQKPNQPIQAVALCPPKSGNGFINSVEHSFSGVYRADLTLPIGTQVFVYTKIVATSVHALKRMEFYVETSNLRILIDRRTRAAASKTKAYLLPDALRHVFGAITSNIDSVTQSGTVHGELIDKANVNQAMDGYATEYAITSGNQLRGLAKVPTFTAKQLMETLWAQHAAGLLYEKDLTTGVQSMRIEEGTWFYRGGEIAVIDEVFEYSEEPDLDLLFNQIEVGYEKYPDSGAGVADEFNTAHTYQTPLVNRVATLEILCPLIAAGTAIEAARRLGIKQVVNGVEVSTTSDAGSYDDDGFLLHVAPLSHPDTVSFIIAQPTPAKPYPAHYVQFTNAVINGNPGGIVLYYGDTVVFSGTGTANDGVPYRVVGVRLETFSSFSAIPTYEMQATTPMVAGGPYACSWQFGGKSVKLRSNERLIVQGVADPETAYNLELSPARMLRRHAPFISSGLAYKKPVDLIKCTAYKQSSKVSTQVRPASPPLPGDRDKQLIRETGNIALGAFEGFDHLFQPELIKAKVRITRQTRRAIFAALKNQGPDDVRCGYLTVINPEGEQVNGYLRSITYRDSSEVADIVLRKRSMTPAGNLPGEDCSLFFDWTLNRFTIDPKANPDKFLFCRFSDFKPA